MFFVARKKTLAIALFVIIAVQITLLFVGCLNMLDKNTAIINFTVVIDAGHGGKDGGVVADDGTKESDLNLAYAKELGNLFSQCGFNVVFTRKNNGGLYGLPTKGFKMRDMQQRKKIIEQSNANLVLSIHMNKYQQSYRKGPQAFFQMDDEQDKLLAQSVQKCLNDFTGNTHQSLQGDYYVLRESNCPAIIVECGFVSNDEELASLKSQEYRAKLCNTIFNGVMMYLCT